MSESEQREIEKEAHKWSRTVMGIEISSIQENEREVDAYIAGATAMAEKNADLQAELSRVKEVAEKMVDGLEYIQWWVEASNKDNNINFDFERINTPLTEFANLMNKEK